MYVPHTVIGPWHVGRVIFTQLQVLGSERGFYPIVLSLCCAHDYVKDINLVPCHRFLILVLENANGSVGHI